MTNIFVGNLSYGSTEDGLRSLFNEYGEVDRISIVTDRDTGLPRGFAFVEMLDKSQAIQAIVGLNGRELDGRALNIDETRARPDRPLVNRSGSRQNRS